MFSFQVLNHPESFSLDESRINEIFHQINKGVETPQQGILNIAFLSDVEIQSLNNSYRGIDSTTDVLSFHYFDDFSDLSETDVAGEIIMSESRIASQAIEYGHSSRDEYEILFIHGILHILGFDHEDDREYEDMWRYEQNIRNNMSLSIN